MAKVALAEALRDSLEVAHWGGLRIENNGNSNDGRIRDVVTPETEDRAQRGDFEGDQESLVEEEVPPSHESPRIVDPSTGETDETTRHGHHDCHFGGTVVYEPEHNAVDSVGQEGASRSTLVQSTTDGNEQRRTDGTTNCQQLDLTVTKTPVEVIFVILRVSQPMFFSLQCSSHLPSECHRDGYVLATYRDDPLPKILGLRIDLDLLGPLLAKSIKDTHVGSSDCVKMEIQQTPNVSRDTRAGARHFIHPIFSRVGTASPSPLVQPMSTTRLKALAWVRWTHWRIQPSRVGNKCLGWEILDLALWPSPPVSGLQFASSPKPSK